MKLSLQSWPERIIPLYGKPLLPQSLECLPIDTPRPNLLDDLVHTIDSHWQARYTSGRQDSRDTLRLRRSLKLLNAILKEFASIKLPNGMKIMGQVCTFLFPSHPMILTE